jgi:hypothetical protein
VCFRRQLSTPTQLGAKIKLTAVDQPTLDERFTQLRRSVDGEIARARREVIEELGRAVARWRSATAPAEWNAAVEQSANAFAGDAPALALLATLTPLIARHVRMGPERNGQSLSAQRFARVKIAEIQLYQATAVKAGREARDLYGSLQPHIDAAREAFRARYLTSGHEMGDYLHAELVRELANDDSALLGPGYPGPMA